jgi:hypothetical protein
VAQATEAIIGVERPFTKGALILNQVRQDRTVHLEIGGTSEVECDQEPAARRSIRACDDYPTLTPVTALSIDARL